MKVFKLFIVFVGLVLGQSLSAQIDTITGRIQPVICSVFSTEYNFHTPYDTAQYYSEWYLVGADTIFSIEDNIAVADADTFLLLSLPKDTNQLAYLDTILIDLRIYPTIDLLVPPIECYQYDTLIIKVQSILHDNYTEVAYREIGGDIITPIDSLIKIFLTNGDSTRIEVNYDIDQCPSIIDTILIGSKFKPEINVEFDEVCFGDSTILINESVFDTSLFSFLLDVENITVFNSSQDSFMVYIPKNGGAANVFVEVIQGDCITYDTLLINNKVQPTALFDVLKTCENELLKISNSSIDSLVNSIYKFSVFGENYEFQQMDTFKIMDAFPNGTYTMFGVLDNNNGCIDSLILDSVEIDSVTYVSFVGLDTTFCELQTIANLTGSVDNGMFEGDYIDDMGNGLATFSPTSSGANIQITYTYTNNLECTDIDTQFVEIVHSKPLLMLDSLPSAYCQLDSSDTIKINQSNALTSLFEIRKDAELFDSTYTLNYLFNINSVGAYSFLNVYTDENGCFDSLYNYTEVNVLPSIALDSVTIIQPGEKITLGDISVMETNVEYEWSNGSILPSIEVDQPGIYTLDAFNVETQCGASDTAKIEFDPLDETDLLEIQISPNPTMGLVTIKLSSFVQNIRLVDAIGDPVSLNGTNLFMTDMGGLLTLNLSSQSKGNYYLIIPNVGNFILVKVN